MNKDNQRALGTRLGKLVLAFTEERKLGPEPGLITLLALSHLSLAALSQHLTNFHPMSFRARSSLHHPHIPPAPSQSTRPPFSTTCPTLAQPTPFPLSHRQRLLLSLCRCKRTLIPSRSRATNAHMERVVGCRCRRVVISQLGYAGREARG